MRQSPKVQSIGSLYYITLIYSVMNFDSPGLDVTEAANRPFRTGKWKCAQFSSLASGSRPWAIGCTTSWSKWVWPLGWGGHLGGPLAKCQDIMLGILQFMQEDGGGYVIERKEIALPPSNIRAQAPHRCGLCPSISHGQHMGFFPVVFFHLCAVITRRNALLSSTIVHAVPPEPRSQSPTTRP